MTQQNPTLEGWEDRFDKQFGKAGSEMDSDSVGRSAGCDDCSINIKLREEHKNFIRTLITAAKEEGYQEGAAAELDWKHDEVKKVVAAAERKAYKTMIDDIPDEVYFLDGSEPINLAELKHYLITKYIDSDLMTQAELEYYKSLKPCSEKDEQENRTN